MMDANLMRLMSLEHLLAAADAEQDALTRTPLETELIRRINELLDDPAPITNESGTEFAHEEIKGLCDAVIEDSETTIHLLETIKQVSITGPDELKDRLELSKFAADLGDKLTEETITELSVFFNQLAERK